jgi:uncharacterized membrane protein
MIRTALSVPRWAVITTFLLSLLGLALSIYLTVAHYEGSQILACSDNGLINCAKVTTSAESHILGIPVALLGLGTYTVLSVLNSPWGWRATNYWLHVARFLLVVASMAFVLWLLTAELLIIDNICLYCTGVHVVTFALFVVMMRVGPTQLGWNRSVAS